MLLLLRSPAEEDHPTSYVFLLDAFPLFSWRTLLLTCVGVFLLRKDRSVCPYDRSVQENPIDVILLRVLRSTVN
jgi:hypothetical protein